MERIELNKNCKQILCELSTASYSRKTDDISDLYILQAVGLIQGSHTKDAQFAFIKLTDYGKAYLSWNPKLKNPSIWEDKKYWITTIVSIIAIIISIIALCK